MKATRAHSFATLSFFILSSALVIAGCAEDKNLDTYRREKAGQELARLQSVNGLYVGDITLNQDRSQGMMSIRLKATTTNQTSADGLSTEQKASLWGEVRYYDSTLKGEAIMSFDNAYFSDLDHTFRASIPLNKSAGAYSGEKLDLFASLENDVLTGRIEVSGVTQNGGNFKLVKQATNSDSQSLVSAPTTPGTPHQDARFYVGYSVSPGNPIMDHQKVILKLRDVDLTNEGTFYTRLQSVRLIEVQTNINNNNIVANTSSAYWDLKAGNLRAKLQITGPAGVSMDIDCYEYGSGKNAGWKCTYTGLNGYLFDVTLKPTKSEQGVLVQ